MSMRYVLIVAGLAALAASPANAQAVVRGAKAGVEVGNKAAGPVGAVVGGAVGATAYGFRAGASRVLGVPEEAGRAPTRRTSQKRVVRR